MPALLWERVHVVENDGVPKLSPPLSKVSTPCAMAWRTVSSPSKDASLIACTASSCPQDVLVLFPHGARDGEHGVLWRSAALRNSPSAANARLRELVERANARFAQPPQALAQGRKFVAATSEVR